MEVIKIDRMCSSGTSVHAYVEIPPYAISLVELCRLTHTGRMTAMALIDAGYLNASTVNGEVMILSELGREALKDLVPAPTPIPVRAQEKRW